MKRPVVGDVFACRLPGGYGFVQLAHKEKEHPVDKGQEFIRLLRGVHPSKEVDVLALVNQPETMMVMFQISRLYRLQGCERIGNFPLPEGYQLPKYSADFRVRQRERQNGRLMGKWAISEVMPPEDGRVHVPMHFPDANAVDDIDVLPQEYCTNLTSGMPDPYLLLYWMAVGANLHRAESLLTTETALDAFAQAIGNCLDHCYQ